ncbi:MAG: YbaB/EbfC family nucleoid-associated protein [Flavobacteriia bacterium]|nr:YbaB/EbfC family nucleoid-associated protein [Flavobacteriia bacterium]OJX36196.1 MAG: nucleoid-associated protein, YbaB/EbfC family [Flavobacteriia bacterium 40-80]
MFGPDQLALMQEMQRKLEESKVRLANSTVEGEAGNGLIRVTLSGDRKLKKLEINADLHNFDKDDLEDLISVALSKALEKADALNETEMAQSASQFLPKF